MIYSRFNRTHKWIAFFKSPSVLVVWRVRRIIHLQMELELGPGSPSLVSEPLYATCAAARTAKDAV